MSTAPYGVRLLVGAAVTAIEETRKLPQTILMYPMTIASQIAQLVMKMQQDVAVLVIKGDETLETIFPPKDEQPEWATFDEDLADAPQAEMGGFLSMREPTKAMREAANDAGVYHYNGVAYPRIQMLTVRELLEEGKTLRTPSRVGTRISTGQAALPL